MRRLYLSATLIFWLLVSAFWAGSVWLPRSDEGVADALERVISTAELARHALAEDCWMAIRGQVHDLGAYLPEHPSRPDIVLPWCGKEATEAYETKTRGRRHSAAADAMLASYRIGVLATDKP
ncbi:MAG: cytochrome b5 domain-containing protein [Candidatus Accumulibacter sp.]|jgi:cytochrome b involved in lipid metabolism|uniref:cytochrome b5 domain-containing protein n=1 Tax=Accumulibacter sp. TaxID=2053492 RepID=UPI001ACC8203|nr:cytochrome b5-like heme/steroid binding domain-containing protein [Accumulibacter sp.]MBN8440028.1 cytochrome b5 domain-containing protein [Accumulibacter sp.]